MLRTSWDVASPWTVHHLSFQLGLTSRQCRRFSRNIAQVTPKISYVHYPKKSFLDQSIQKLKSLILKKTSLLLGTAIRNGQPKTCSDSTNSLFPLFLKSISRADSTVMQVEIVLLSFSKLKHRTLLIIKIYIFGLTYLVTSAIKL